MITATGIYKVEYGEVRNAIYMVLFESNEALRYSEVKRMAVRALSPPSGFNKQIESVIFCELDRLVNTGLVSYEQRGIRKRDGTAGYATFYFINRP